MKITWKGDSDLKCSVVTNLVRHREADQIRRMDYASFRKGRFQGCALGCTLVPFGANSELVEQIDRDVRRRFGRKRDDRDWARAVASRYGLPVWLARLDEAIFESTKDYDWPVTFASAVPVGVPYRELEVRVYRELKRRIKASGIRYFAALAEGVEDFWGEPDRKMWKTIRGDLLELLQGTPVEMPQPLDCPALTAPKQLETVPA